MNESPTLYHLGYCPFCQKVRRAADDLDIELRLVDIDETPEARAYLTRHLGRSTVPVLGIRSGSQETLLPESDDIVRYLKDNAAELRRRRAA